MYTCNVRGGGDPKWRQILACKPACPASNSTTEPAILQPFDEY